MASEYLKWLARNEKPEEKRELTPEEKRRNWWDYHKTYVIVGLVAIVVIVFSIYDTIANREAKPDYQVAYVGSIHLPEDTLSALEVGFAELGEDLNQDGEVLVQVNEYLLFADESLYAEKTSAQMTLVMDVTAYDSFVFLMEDPVSFQTQCGILSYPDGSLPEEGEIADGLWFSWADCPVLTELPLGSYTSESAELGDNQELLSKLYIARRGFGEDCTVENMEGLVAFWQKMIENAN